ncbi:MAG: FlgD immunoglobulin-like domain containing protein [Candidatus Cloacimonadota bacterium]|nr:FlgD immunoglobulin-like domain containing protein [Candidatus Cloacimonadota bacterium]
MKKFSFIIIILFTFFIFVTAIEVGGHLTEDTTWSPDNNPYLVTSGVYVDDGVTLTILPGTIVKFYSDYYDDLGDDQFYFHNGEEPIAKFMRVEGRVIAEGTEQDSIIFTRMQDEQYYHWGTIYLPVGAQQSSFKHCLFEFSAFTGFSIWEQPHGAISMWNGSAKIDNCSFIDNDTAIGIERNVVDILILDNYFDYNEYFHPYIMNNCGNSFIRIRYIFEINEGTPLIANNTFIHGKTIHTSKSVIFIANNIDMVPYNRDAVYIACEYGESYCYDNYFGSCSKGIRGGFNNTDSIYIKNNYFNTIGGDGVYIDDAYVEICDNYFEGCDLTLYHSYSSRIINNTINNSSGIAISSNTDVITNNIINNCNTGLSGRGSTLFSNNIFINNNSAFSFLTDNHVIENEIIIYNDELISNPYTVYGNPILRNCILDFELPPECINGGGNIWVDSLQAQTLFEDIQNGDFHLIEGSLAIDAGFDTLGYYYPFDMDYNHRVWDGDNNGTAIIDIGPYEYNSPSFGGIEGYTYNPTTGDPVDYVLLKINNEPGEFTFSDSIGNFEYKLPAGIYNVYSERVFYEDVIEYQVEVIDGQFTQLNIPMYETVDIDNNKIIPMKNNLDLTNFPNPFNPVTTISFSVTQNSDFVNLEVYNIKGQKVKTLLNEQMQKGKHSIVWLGLDSNNKPVSSGIYLYKIKAGNQESVKRMLLLK